MITALEPPKAKITDAVCCTNDICQVIDASRSSSPRPQRYAKKLMRLVLSIAATWPSSLALADSGGPYEGVPDIRKDDQPPIFSIPANKEPLRYFLQHMPKLRLNRALNEPDSYTWTEISGCHASFRALGEIRGRQVYEVRYVSDSRLDQGLDYADAILILARGFDTGPDNAKLVPIYFTTGGTSYDRRAEYLPDADKFGAVKVTDWWSGTGPGRWSAVFIRGTEDLRFERFTPTTSKVEQDDGGQPAARPEAE